MNLTTKDLKVSALDHAVLHLVCHVARSKGVLNTEKFFLVQEGEGLEEKASISLAALLFSSLTSILHLLVVQRNLKDERIIHSLNGTRRESPYSNNVTHSVSLITISSFR